MTSISSIINAAVCFSMALGAMAGAAERNYSLWPRRPAELEQARRLVRDGKAAEAVELLSPFVRESGISGREARQIAGAVNVRRYLTRQHPKAQVISVKRGETLASLAASHRCPADVMMMLNGIVSPSSLKIGQKLVVVPMDLRAEIHPARREISVWDGGIPVADYNLLEIGGVDGKGNEETSLLSRDGYVQSVKIPPRSPQYPSCDRGISLENGQAILAHSRSDGGYYRMEQRDLNELAMLLGPGARISIVRDADTFYDPAAAEEMKTEPQP